VTVYNYLGWCKVTLNGTAESFTLGTTTHSTVSVSPGTLVPVVLEGAPGFVVGTDPFQFVGDAGAVSTGDPNFTDDGGLATYTVSAGSTGICVQVCCPDQAPTPNDCTGVTNNCP
jgi:hypothetical protein